MKKEKVIDIEAHAFLRMLERGSKYGLNYYECKERAFKTVRLGNLAKRKHLSKTYITILKIICRFIPFATKKISEILLKY